MAIVPRTDLGGSVSNEAGAALLSLVHLSDMHVLDAASPARAEWVELLGSDPVFRPLLHMHRPYDTLTHFALAAHVDAIRADPAGPQTGRPYDLAVSTGDNIDNAQRNELDAYLALMAGGTAQLGARGSAQDPTGDPALRPWPYWSPDASVTDEWRRLGYPAVDEFVERASAPIVSSGLGLPWTSVPGNHDLMRQGTALETDTLARIAVAASKSLRRPDGFTPLDAIATYLDQPELFSTGTSFPLGPDPLRRIVDRTEWVMAHRERGALGYADGDALHRHREGIDRIIDTDHVRLVLLDTNHPAGDYQGSIGTDQLEWLDERLSEVDRQPGRVAVLVSHHGADTLVNERGHDAHRRLAADMLHVVHRHRSVIAWLVGHRHINRIEPRPGPSGGFWEITTASTIDWPSQVRSIELIRHGGGDVELACTMRDHLQPDGGLGHLHHDLARRFASTGVATRMAGREIDGDVRLVVPARG